MNLNELIDLLKNNEELHNEFVEEIKELTGTKCKLYSFSYSLWYEIIYTIGEILNHLPEKKLYYVDRYFLKPLIEDYVNFLNLQYYRKDYARAMQIHFLAEDSEAKNKYEQQYNQLGVVFTNVEKITETQDKHKGRIKNIQIKKYINDYYMLSINNRFKLLKNSNNTQYEILKALYDYANNYGHLNLRYMRHSVQDREKLSAFLEEWLETITKKSTALILELFDLVEEDDFSSIYMECKGLTVPAN